MKRRLVKATALALTLATVLSLTACGSRPRIGSANTGMNASDSMITGGVMQGFGVQSNEDSGVTGGITNDAIDEALNQLPPFTDQHAEPPVVDSPTVKEEYADTDGTWVQVEQDENWNTESYNHLVENRFKDVKISPLSTFAADVDTASYSNIKRMIEDDLIVPAGAIRLEEMMNYFKYDYKAPSLRDEVPFGVTTEVSTCPWNEDNVLLQIGLRTPEIDKSNMPRQNIVLLLDISGSMTDSLPLVKKSMEMYINNMSSQDSLSVITYSSYAECLFSYKEELNGPQMIDAINSICAGGGTNASDGLKRAYELAASNYISDGNNLIILASDGDFNIGMTDNSSLANYVREQAKNGIHISTFGYGYGNYKDDTMELIANNGDGMYYYINTMDDAKEVMIEAMGGKLVTVAKDVKYQVEFNPSVVSQYRQIGYENRQMAAEDFNDDTKDGGEIGAGQTTTVLYELVLNNGPDSNKGSGIDLKYQTSTEIGSSDICTVAIRYKEPNGVKSKLSEYPVPLSTLTDNMSNNMKLAASVAEFGMLLKESEYSGDSSYEQIMQLISDVDFRDEKQDYVDEFVRLVNLAYHLYRIK